MSVCTCVCVSVVSMFNYKHELNLYFISKHSLNLTLYIVLILP